MHRSVVRRDVRVPEPSRCGIHDEARADAARDDQPARERFELLLCEYRDYVRAGGMLTDPFRKELLALYDERPAQPAAPVCGTCLGTLFITVHDNETAIGRRCPACTEHSTAPASSPAVEKAMRYFHRRLAEVEAAKQADEEKRLEKRLLKRANEDNGE